MPTAAYRLPLLQCNHLSGKNPGNLICVKAYDIATDVAPSAADCVFLLISALHQQCEIHLGIFPNFRRGLHALNREEYRMIWGTVIIAGPVRHVPV